MKTSLDKFNEIYRVDVDKSSFDNFSIEETNNNQINLYFDKILEFIAEQNLKILKEEIEKN